MIQYLDHPEYINIIQRIGSNYFNVTKKYFIIHHAAIREIISKANIA